MGAKRAAAPPPPTKIVKMAKLGNIARIKEGYFEKKFLSQLLTFLYVGGGVIFTMCEKNPPPQPSF